MISGLSNRNNFNIICAFLFTKGCNQTNEQTNSWTCSILEIFLFNLNSQGVRCLVFKRSLRGWFHSVVKQLSLITSQEITRGTTIASNCFFPFKLRNGFWDLMLTSLNGCGLKMSPFLKVYRFSTTVFLCFGNFGTANFSLSWRIPPCNKCPRLNSDPVKKLDSTHNRNSADSATFFLLLFMYKGERNNEMSIESLP